MRGLGEHEAACQFAQELPGCQDSARLTPCSNSGCGSEGKSAHLAEMFAYLRNGPVAPHGM